MSQLEDFLRERLKSDHAKPFADESSPPWWEDGVTVQIDESTYSQYLELASPRFMNAHLFAYGEGAGSFIFFWKENTRYFGHQLSRDDTQMFCRLSQAPLHLWRPDMLRNDNRSNPE